MNHIKTFLLTAMLLIAGRTYADNLVVPDITLAAGETKTLDIELVNTDKQYTGFQFDLVLPEGVSIAKDEYDDWDAVLSRSPKNKHTFEVSSLGSDTYRLLAFNTSNIEFSGQSGTIVSISLVAATDATGGAQTASVKGIVLTAADASELKPDDINFTITLPEAEPAITVTAKSYSRAYGEANPTFEYDVTGGTLTGTPTLTCSATATSDVGEYDIVVAQGSVTNTNITYVNGTLTITKATPTVTAPTAIEGTLTYSGAAQNLVNAGSTTGGELQYALSAGGTYSTTIPQGTAAGDYTIYYKVVGGTNYEDVAEAGPVNKSIAQKTLTITADAKSKVYGAADPALTYTSNGLVEGDAITGALTRAEGEDVGEYNITQGTLTAGNNYAISFTGAKLTITKATPTVTAPTAIEGTLTYSGAAQNLVNAGSTTGGELQYALSAGGTYSTTIPQGTAAGDYTIYYKVVGGTNYEDVAEAGPVNKSIAQKTLTITADAKSKVYGAADPALTYTSNGLVEGDAITGALTRAEGEDVGEYNITQGTLTAGNNYAISYTGAKLTISQKEATLTWSNTEFTYNGQEQKPTATVSNLVGNDQCTVTVSGATNAGNHTSTASALSNANYKLPDAKTQGFTISKALLFIWAGNYSMEQGAALPEFQAEYSGFVNGETETVMATKPTLTTTATSASPHGKYDVVVSGAVAANYDIVYDNGTLTIYEVIVNDGGTTIKEIEDGDYSVTIDESIGGGSEDGIISDALLDANGSVVVTELTYKREMNAPSGSTGDVTIDNDVAQLYTICLPFAPTTATSNLIYYTLDAANSTTLSFKEVDNSNVSSNTPYLVAVLYNDHSEHWYDTHVTLKKEVDNSVEKDGFIFKGTLTGLTNAEAAAAGAYILQSGNVWGKVTTAKPAAYIPPFRAYIVPTSSNAPAILNGNIGDGTTGIQTIRTIDLDGTERWYDLNGKRIQKPTKGINIRNGRKVVIK